MSYSAIFDNVFQALNLVLIVFIYLCSTEIQLPGHGIRLLSITQSSAMSGHWWFPSHHEKYKSWRRKKNNSSCQQLVLTVACRWASLLKPYVRQTIFSFHHSTKHEPLPLSFTEAWQDANRGCCSSLWPLCSVLLCTNLHSPAISDKGLGCMVKPIPYR